MVSADEALASINSVYGKHHARALHAKGRFFAGTFTAAPVAATLTRAAHMQGAAVPVYVRWSDGAGRPDARDDKPDVRGMAVSFRLPDGGATDILGQTAPRFPVGDVAGFLEFMHAAQPGLRGALRMPVFIAKHPSAAGALVANLRAGAIAPPRSFAEASYYAVHAYRWLAADGSARWVRYTLRPEAQRGNRPRPKGADALLEEIARRLADHPVRFTLQIQVAGEGDDPHRPDSVWRTTERIDVGTIEVTGPDPDRERDGEVVVFDPTRVVDGIELSDDPILRFRPQVYSLSVENRL